MSPLIQNVHRVERAISIVAGVSAIVSGVYRGGFSGILAALGGAAAVQRGLSGHCVLKGLIMDAESELRCLRQRANELRAALPETSATSASDKRAEDAKLDHAVEETFPASDPISP